MVENTLSEITGLDQQRISQLMGVWADSVKANHDFLTEADIIGLKPLVEQALGAVAHLVCVLDENEDIRGFMGVAEDKIEMLFLSPSMFGKGLGKQLLTFAFTHYNARFVDVNVQNRQARGFYEHMGFEVIGRSPLDDQGRPFPILHMQIKSA